MTLLEVVVALTIAGAALAVGATALGFLTDQQDRTGAQAVTSANTVRTSLRDWVTEARLTTSGDAEFRGVASSRAMQSGEDDELTFVTSAPTHIGSLGTIVHLYIARGAAERQRLLLNAQPPRLLIPCTFRKKWNKMERKPRRRRIGTITTNNLHQPPWNGCTISGTSQHKNSQPSTAEEKTRQNGTKTGWGQKWNNNNQRLAPGLLG